MSHWSAFLGYSSLLARLGVATAFLWAGVFHLLQPTVLPHAILHYHMVGAAWAQAMSRMLPSLELVIGLALLSGWMRHGATLLAVLLLVIFTGANAQVWMRGIDLRCGCFTASGARPAVALVRDLFLLALTVHSSGMSRRIAVPTRPPSWTLIDDLRFPWRTRVAHRSRNAP